MKAVYVPKVNPSESHLHIKEMMHQTLTKLLKSGKLHVKIPAAKLNLKGLKGLKHG